MDYRNNIRLVRKPKSVITLVFVITMIIVFMAVINLIPPKVHIEVNPFVKGAGEKTMIAAHRGGGKNNPENTMLAFTEAVDTIGVDILESDLYLTKDGYLVFNHDEYIDRTSNVNGDVPQEQAEENRHYIRDLTLEELQQYNFGYYFTDESGERIYKDVEDPAAAGLQIATVDQLFETFYESNPDLMFILEIKDEGDRGREACRFLWQTLQNYPDYLDQIVVGSFHEEIEKELKEEYPTILRGASTGSAGNFIITHFFRMNLLSPADFACLQIPTEYDLGINVTLDKEPLIEQAHKRNIAVQYWTINDPEEMQHLIKLGCDCIMTDDPALLKEVLG